MNDHVAVLRDIIADKGFDITVNAEDVAAIKHAITTCEQHAALVARLGECQADAMNWRLIANAKYLTGSLGLHYGDDVFVLDSMTAGDDEMGEAAEMAAHADDLARVVKENDG